METPLFHVLVAHVWNVGAAWSCTGLHMVLILYLVDDATPLPRRSVRRVPDRIEIRPGAIANRTIALPELDRLTAYDGHGMARGDGRCLFGLDEPNMRLTTEGSRPLFRVDEPAGRLAALA